MRRWLWGALILASALAPTPALAQVQGAVGAGGRLSNLEGGGEVDVRLRLPSRVQLGLTLRGARSWNTYLGGYAEDDGANVEGLLHTMLPLASRDDLEVGLRVSLGGRYQAVDSPQGPYGSATRLTNELGPIALWRVHPNVGLRLGWLNVFELEVDPTVQVATLGQRVLLGAVVSLGGGALLYADVGAVGTFGFDGDNEKFQVEGAVGLRWTFGDGADEWRLF